MLETILHLADKTLFFFVGLSIIYLFVLAIASRRKYSGYLKANKQNRMIVLVPDGTTFPFQEYPEELYKVENYTDLTDKVKTLDESCYDLVVIFKAITQVSPQLLGKINILYNTGIKAIQLHTVAEEYQGFGRRWKAILKEVDHNLYKKGNTRLGLSSAFTGPDIAVELKWLKRNQKTPGSNLERKLLKQDIYVEYLGNSKVYHKSVQKENYNTSRSKALSQIMSAFLSGNWNYVNRLFQHLLPSPLGFFILTVIWLLLMTICDWTYSIKWWFILFFLSFTISLVIPDYLVADRKKKNKN